MSGIDQTPMTAPPSDQAGALQPTLAALRATVGARIRDYDKKRALERLQDAALRGAMAGVAVRGGLHLVTFAMHMALRGKRRRAPGQPNAAAMLKDTARWGAFLGCFSGGFVFWEELIACLGGARTQAWRAMAAGALAGPAMLLAGSEASHMSLATYLFVRSVVLLVRCGNLPQAAPWKRKLLAPTRSAHGDVALMCLGTMQLAWAWICLPQTLPSSFVRFLNKHGAKPLYVYEAIREMSGRAADGLPPGRLAALAGTEAAGFCGSVACPIMHPGQSCMGHAAGFLPAAYLRALPVYLPVYVIPALFVHRKKLISPTTAPVLWRKVGLGVLRSSLFLSLYCTLAWRGVCTGFNLAGRTSGGVLALSCWVAGFSVLVEKKSRRMELALYLLARAVESFGLTLLAWGWLRPGTLPRRTDVLLFSLAAGFVLHCYSDHLGERRNVFRSSYLAAFDFILGNTGFEAASISHHPSNAALLLRGVRSVRSLSNLFARGATGRPLSRRGSGASAGSSAAATPAELTPRPSSPQLAGRRVEEGVEEREEEALEATAAAAVALAEESSSSSAAG